MAIVTSSDFASVCVEGTDWRDTAKEVLEQLEMVKTRPDYFNFGFVYVSEALCDDTNSILNLFKSVLNIDHWIVASSPVVIGNDMVCSKNAAISAMICRFPEDSFCFMPSEDDHDLIVDSREWLKRNYPVFSLVHPFTGARQYIADSLEDISRQTQSFLIGGVGNDLSYLDVAQSHEGVILFSDDVPVSTTLAQGVENVGPYRTITKCDNNTILEIDHERALDVFERDLRDLAARKLEKSSDDFVASLGSIASSDHIPGEFKSLFQGHVHVALPINQSDQRNYVVHDIVHIDTDEGSITISEALGNGDAMLLVERNEETIRADLADHLVKLRKRVQSERQSFNPRAALYISCISRIRKVEDQEYEINMIKDVIGQVPLAGFYAQGEIYNTRLHSHSAVLVLFF